MSDIKLFRIETDSVTELRGQSVTLEKSIQNLIEKHLVSFLGVRFLASEYSTGKKHGGRIDTLGIDENGCPVIIEYKRALNENVINQGLFYLDWLLDHKAEFKLLVMDKLNKEAADGIEWSSPRMLCIAGDFTKYDVHAVKQINRNIELIRYRKYDEGNLILLELINATTAAPAKNEDDGEPSTPSAKSETTFEYCLSQADEHITDLYEAARAFMKSLGDDVIEKQLKYYVAFRRMKNFACVEVHPQSRKVLIYIKVPPNEVEIEEGFTRDMRSIGHYGTGDLEICLTELQDLEKAKALILRSYEAN
ncbi:MAG: DUF91 domain-containing protein [Proteobacteria bacterium]|nr:DUF91 domain-containing protein [Pseudomonadota bacterium]